MRDIRRTHPSKTSDLRIRRRRRELSTGSARDPANRLRFFSKQAHTSASNSLRRGRTAMSGNTITTITHTATSAAGISVSATPAAAPAGLGHADRPSRSAAPRENSSSSAASSTSPYISGASAPSPTKGEEDAASPARRSTGCASEDGFPEALRERVKTVGTTEGAALMEVTTARFTRLARLGLVVPVKFYLNRYRAVVWLYLAEELRQFAAGRGERPAAERAYTRRTPRPAGRGPGPAAPQLAGAPHGLPAAADRGSLGAGRGRGLPARPASRSRRSSGTRTSAPI